LREKSLSAHTDRPRKRIALVTGGSRGIGRNTVLSLARDGVDSLFTYHSNRGEAEKVVLEVQALGATAVALQLDVANSASFSDFAKEVEKALAGMQVERFDYLINNAGTSLGKSFEETTEADLDTLYNVHLKGPFFLTQRLLPLIQDGGRIVNISSGLTRFTSPKRIAYASMKSAVETLTLYLLTRDKVRFVDVVE